MDALVTRHFMLDVLTGLANTWDTDYSPLLHSLLKAVEANFLCYLSEEQVSFLFKTAQNAADQSVCFAFPAFRIKHSYHVLHLDYIGNGMFKLGYYFPKRTLQSYSAGNEQRDLFDTYHFQSEAMQFAEENWGAELILDTWASMGVMHFEDPTQLDENGYPKHVKDVFWATKRKWNEVLNDISEPEHLLFDAALTEVTSNPVIGSELCGGRGRYTSFNCAHCGGGLGLDKCHSCGHTFTDNQWRSGWYTPAPQKIIQLLQSEGHTFGVDPSQAHAWMVDFHQQILALRNNPKRMGLSDQK